MIWIGDGIGIVSRVVEGYVWTTFLLYWFVCVSVVFGVLGLWGLGRFGTWDSRSYPFQFGGMFLRSI